MATIKASSGAILVRPGAAILATDCGQAQCHPCITGEQEDAAVAVVGGCLTNQYPQSAVIQVMPGTLLWCEAWAGTTWAGTCCWVWANYVDIGQWVPGWICDYVLIVCYDAPTDTFTAAIYMGADIDNGDPCDWMVNDTPSFTATGIATSPAIAPAHYLECGVDHVLHGTFQMIGQDPNWIPGDATGCTATVTL